MHVRVYFEMMPELIPSKKEDTYNDLFEKALKRYKVDSSKRSNFRLREYLPQSDTCL
jgi:cation transport regulator ChaB